ncbi:MAG: hypothetical protein EA377_03715 [Phycisphaerales bacterium]|nr:MAG: hypothetical protein EA377_03715 [Phycisphaerales bacterium]
MLLTLSTRSLQSLCGSKNGDGALDMLDVPKFAMNELQLRGLSVPTSMLVGWSISDLDRLRDRADKAACPCLIMLEDTPTKLAVTDASKAEPTIERVRMLAMAANRLGCNSLGLTIEADDSEESFDLLVERLRDLMSDFERHELNMLLAPHTGLTFCPDRLTELIKRIGGFRIGSLPSFSHAAETGDAVATLRKLAPYAGAIHASIQGFSKAGKHEGYDLTELVLAIRSVGFLNTLAIEYLGKKDPVATIEQARIMLQDALDSEME